MSHIADTKENRRHAVEYCINSARLEGGDVTTQWKSDANEYIEGLIDLSELRHRTRARYGYDAAGRPAIRMRDGKTANQIEDESRANPAYPKRRKEAR